MHNWIVFSEYQAFPEVTAISINRRQLIFFLTTTCSFGIEMILTYCPNYPNPFTREGSIHYDNNS